MDIRSVHSPWVQGAANNVIRPLDPQQPILAVTPLTSVPYTGPPPMHVNNDSSPAEIDTRLPMKNHPAMVFLPSHSTEEEWNKVVAATKHGIAITGSAALGMLGPALGLVDIAESADAYLFRVSLPGVARDEKEFVCDVDPNGKVMIKGSTSTGEKKVQKKNMVFEMQTQNLCPPGEFSISFQLPGPVDHQQLNHVFGTDGIFEGVVKKRLPKLGMQELIWDELVMAPNEDFMKEWTFAEWPGS
ncbi:hypothetical protein RJ640_025032, partial [Escallonia rubra]